MEHRDGAISTTASSLDCAGPNTAVIYGTKARIEIASVWYSPTSFRVINYKGRFSRNLSRRFPAAECNSKPSKWNALSGLVRPQR